MPDPTEYTPGNGGGPLAEELDAERRADEIRRNERRTIRRLAEANHKAGKPTPQPGMVLYVSTAKGITGRRRAGIDFVNSARVKVALIDASNEEVAAKLAAGELVANEAGAHAILADDSLTVHAGPAPVGTSDELVLQLAAKDSEIATLRAQLAARPSRVGEGGPERLGKGRRGTLATPPQMPPDDAGETPPPSGDFGDDKPSG